MSDSVNRWLDAIPTVAANPKAATQLDLLEDAHERLLSHLDTVRPFTCVCFDTVLYELYDEPSAHYAWAIDALRHWLQRNSQLALETRRSPVFRYVFLPVREAIRPRYLRLKHFLDVVVFNLHLNLWHGVITIVVFLDPALLPPKALARTVNSVVLPGAGLTYTSADFYGSVDDELLVLSGSEARQHRRVLRGLVEASRYEPIQLWYDERNFSKPRLRGSRWEAIRSLFLMFEDEPFVCPVCRERRLFTLDHILPITDDHPQTLLNFTPLCVSCNSSKRDAYPRFDPFAFPQFVPGDFRTDWLRMVLRRPPPWLGTIRRPDRVRTADDGLL